MHTARVFVGNMAWDAEQEGVKEFFSQCGEVVDVHIAYDQESGRAKGFCHVEFAALEGAAAAIALNGAEYLGRNLRTDSAQERRQSTGGGFGAGGGGEERPKREPRESDERTAFVKGFPREMSEDDIRNGLFEAFAECGEVWKVRIPTDRDTGEIKGFAFVEFENVPRTVE